MMNLRKATYEDFEILFKWANDKEVRKNSFNTEKIEMENHKKWLKNKLEDENTEIYIILKYEQEVGVIRLDKNKEGYIISYSIDKEFRGEGIGTDTLIYIKNNIENKPLVGFVRHDNIVSNKAFEKAGYDKIIYKDYIKFIYKG